MKIDKSSTSLPLAPAAEGKARAAIANPSDNAPSTAASSTNVNLGTTATQLRSMGGSVANTPVNASKVAEIKLAISEGRFQVNASAVADSLIRSVTDLISAQKA